MQNDSENTSETRALLHGDQTAVYRIRWYIIAVFSFGCFTQAMVWNTWGPIAESAKAVFGWSDSDVGMMPSYGNIAFIIFVVPLCIFADVKGLRLAMLICSFMVMLSTVVRCISMEPVYMRWLANLGAWSVGVGETVPLAGPPKVSSTWFPPDQRTSATSLIAFCDYMGVAVSFILGSQLVRSPVYGNATNVTSDQSVSLWTDSGNHSINTTVLLNKSELVDDIRNLMYFHGGLGVLLFVLVLVYFPAHPPRPPSQSAATERTQWISGLRALVRNRAYWLVVVACSTPAGILGVWQSVLNINLSSRGISQITAGYLGFYQTVAGCIAGLLVGWFSDMFMKRMRITLIVLFTGASMATAWFTLICEKIIPLNYPSLYISCILIGVFINGGIPLFYEVACEASFPVGEGVAGGVLTLVNNLVGVLFLAVLFIKNISYDWMNWVLLGSSVLALPLLLCFPERYNRTDLDIAPHTREM